MNNDQNKMNSVLARLRLSKPRTKRELHAWLQAYLGARVPRKRLCPNHDSPFDYLAHSFLAVKNQSQDIIVWANRGGGKTMLGAISSILDCIFNPHCSVRILGGSEQQAQQMYGHVRQILADQFDDMLLGKVTARRCRFNNGSDVQILTQSQSSVRGQHVQRLRCDEVELFDPDIWQAAQFITQSAYGIPARLEALSTMHLPFGLMNELVSNFAPEQTRIFRWCIMEVLERCTERNCSQCYLAEDCQGRARQADGYFAIDDAIAQKRRASKKSWQSEMLCLRPSMEDVVFAEFDPKRHIKPVTIDHNAQLYRSFDFGFSNPLACLLIQVAGDLVFVLDEHILSRTTLNEHAKLIKDKWPYTFANNYCDPAGRQRNEITGTSPVSELAAMGIICNSRPTRISDGIDLIRDHLLSGDDTIRLYIDPKCKGLITALQSLRYKRTAGSVTEQPHKDGIHDHVIDALRYFFVNRFGVDTTASGRCY